MVYLQSAYNVTTKCLLHTYKVPTMNLQSAYYHHEKSRYKFLIYILFCLHPFRVLGGYGGFNTPRREPPEHMESQTKPKHDLKYTKYYDVNIKV